MPLPITIEIVRRPEWNVGDTGQIRIDGTLQHDRVTLVESGRESLGFGGEPFGQGPFGGAYGPGFGLGVFGVGSFGFDDDVFSHRTLRSYPSGDYSIELRSSDPLGNLSGWSAPVVLRHLAPPNPPTNLMMTGTVLSWDWSE